MPQRSKNALSAAAHKDGKQIWVRPPTEELACYRHASNNLAFFLWAENHHGGVAASEQLTR